MPQRSKKIAFACGLTVFLTGVILFFEFHGWFASAEAKILDAVLRRGQNEKPSDILTIEIEDADYQTCFKGTSPLRPAKVLDAVALLSNTQAAVVGVDIITDDPEYERLLKPGNLRYKELLKPDNLKKVVWIASSESSEEPTQNFFSWLLGETPLPTVTPGEVLGRKNVRSSQWGIPLFPADEDSRIRRAYKEFLVANDPNSPKLDSWAQAIAKKYSHAVPKDVRGYKFLDNKEEVAFIRYSRIVGRIPFSRVFKCSDKSKVEEAPRFKQLEYILNKDSKKKIVMLGGTFKSGRDTYDTPIGPLPGLVVNAYVVDSLLNDSVLRETNPRKAILVDLVIGFAIVVVFAFDTTFVTALWSSAGIIMLAVFAVGAFLGLEYLPGFIGITLGVLVHQIYGAVEKERERAHAA